MVSEVAIIAIVEKIFVKTYISYFKYNFSIIKELQNVLDDVLHYLIKESNF